MHEVLKRIDGSSRVRLGAVLHVGAGSGRELEDYSRLKAEKILLVEANPELAKRLLKRAQESQQVQVVSSAVAAMEGQSAVLHVLSNPRESTVMQPAPLLRCFPNLRVTGEVSVPVIPLSQLIDRLAPDSARPNLLVLEMQGAEFPVLSATPAKDLQKFSWLAVRTSAESLYDGGASAEEVNALLGRAGFKPVPPSRPRSIPPFQNLLYQLDAPRLALNTLREKITKLQQLLEQKSRLASGYQEQLQQLAKAGQEQAERIAKLENDQTELAYRQKLLDEETLKAEAQIELIKDLLLREKAF